MFFDSQISCARFFVSPRKSPALIIVITLSIQVDDKSFPEPKSLVEVREVYKIPTPSTVILNVAMKRGIFLRIVGIAK